MQTRRAHDYVFTGVLHWYLQGVQAGAVLERQGPNAPGLVWHLTEYLSSLAAFGFDITARALWELQGIRDELAAEPAGSVLTAQRAADIQRIAAAAQSTLYAEGATKQVFVPTEKRFPVQRLLYDVRSLLRDGTLDRLPPQAAMDLMNAARCLAFECTTASAFHSLRATESVLRHFYSEVIKRNRIKGHWGWKAMTDQMSKRRTPPSKTLLDNLDALRGNFRNPTAHPEATYDVSGAEELFGACIDVINRMTRAKEWRDPTESWGSLLARFQALADEAAAGPSDPS